MKKIYIISLILSSVFAYKHVSAETYTKIHNFFIPQGTFQENTTIKTLKTPEPAPTTKETNTAPAEPKQQPTLQITRNPATTQQAKQQTKTVEKTKNQEQPTLKITRKPAATQQATQQTKNAEKTKNKEQPTRLTTEERKQIQEIAQKYQLDDNIKAPTLSIKEEEKEDAPKELTLKEMLNRLPFPDVEQPKFKQLYHAYGLELRTLYRRGKFPSNTEQDATLAKAKSMQRFKVQ